MRLTLYMTVIVLFFTIPTVISQIRKDHMLHFGAGMVTGGAGALIASELSDGNRFWTFTGAVVASTMAGLAKETIDKSNGKEWESSDVIATSLGGITVGVTIDLFGGRSRRNRKP